MKILSPEQLRYIDQQTILDEGISSISLMERASKTFVESFKKQFASSHQIYVFCGSGNNGGDGWCIARMLSDIGYHVEVIHSDSISTDNQLSRSKFTSTYKGRTISCKELLSGTSLSSTSIFIDAIFGCGLDRPVEGIYDQLIDFINRANNTVVSVDIPSGIHAENGIIGLHIKAKFTYSFESPKYCFFEENASVPIGDWCLLDIGLSQSALSNLSVDRHYIDDNAVKKMWVTRNPFSHKGDHGRALLIAGSRGMMGACILASKACLRSGIGLLHVHVPNGYDQLLHTTSPEAMIVQDVSENEFSNHSSNHDYDVIGIGPGLGRTEATKSATFQLIKSSTAPIVLDADALNIIADSISVLDQMKEVVLTPHPGEFDRLFGKHANRQERITTQIEMSKKYKIYIVLKGKFSSISCPDGSIYFNNTGNAGLAKGGSGDILTGMIVALIGRVKNIKSAVLTAVYLHGYAADLAKDDLGMESMLATDVIDHIASAMKKNQLI